MPPEPDELAESQSPLRLFPDIIFGVGSLPWPAVAKIVIVVLVVTASYAAVVYVAGNAAPAVTNLSGVSSVSSLALVAYLATRWGMSKRRADRLKAQLAAMRKAPFGPVWGGKLIDPTPPFPPLTPKTAKVISVLNLMDQVGKTTLTASLGAVLSRKHRVLLVDLDFNGGLTRHCRATGRRLQVPEGATAARLLRGDYRPAVLDATIGSVVLDGTEQRPCDLIAADASLEGAEVDVLVGCLLRDKPDARFRFREVFRHSPLCDRYDYILLDCPPRLTGAGVNALSCSDFLLLPVVPTKEAVAGLAQTLCLVGGLQNLVLEQLRFGVVVNRVEYDGEQPVRPQQRVLQRKLSASWRQAGRTPAFVERVRRQDPPVVDLFEGVATAMVERVPWHG